MECRNFRNYEDLKLNFKEGINLIYGDNAQGKTNILEAIFISSTTRSHKGSKDREVIRFQEREAHIRTGIIKTGIRHKIDIHLKKDTPKGAAIDGIKIKKAAEILGFLNVVMFSPEDLSIIKSGPSERRRFIDRELCQIDALYLQDLYRYNAVVNQRNALLKEGKKENSFYDSLDIWNEQMISYGSRIIKRRELFLNEISRLLVPVHQVITENGEEIEIRYDPNTSPENFKRDLERTRERDMILGQTGAGPHRDDFSVICNGINIREYGSQGQQKSAALSLKMAEIELIKKERGEMPVLLLDDVLSELDNKRQESLLKMIKGTQTIMTGTGITDIIRKNIKIDRIIKVKEGTVFYER